MLGVCDGDKLIEVYDTAKIIKINELDAFIDIQQEKDKLTKYLAIFDKVDKELTALRKEMKIPYFDYIDRTI